MLTPGSPLFLDDQGIARLLFGSGSRSVTTWRTAQVEWLRRGMPTPEPVSGLWYVPAVRAWLDSHMAKGESSLPPALPAGTLETKNGRRNGVRCARA